MLKDPLLYDYAMSHVGLPYRWGGDDPIKGFDCSGLVIELLQSVGVLPNRYDATAQSLYLDLEAESETLKKPTFGALLFFGEGLRDISHVGFAMDEFRMLEAGGGGSKTTSQDAAADQNAYIRVRPIKIRKDLVAILLPRYTTAKDKG